MLRKAVPILIILILLLSIIGHFPLLKIKQWEIRREVGSRIKTTPLKNKLHVISAESGKTSLLAWKENGKELEYEERMYDVVYSDTLNGVVNYYCIADDEETELLSAMENLFESEGGGHHGGEKAMGKLVKLLFSLLYLPPDKACLSKPVGSFEVILPAHSLHLSIFIKDILQPPKLPVSL